MKASATVRLTALQAELILREATLEAEEYERKNGLKPPHTTPSSFPKMNAVIVPAK